MPSTSTPESGSSRMRIFGMGSSASASSTRCNSPPESVPTRLSMSASPWYVRQGTPKPFPAWPLSGAETRGGWQMQQVNRSDHAHGVAAVKGRALRHIADAQLLPRLSGGLMEGDFALVLPLAQNGTDKRGFARAVRADQRDHLAAVHMQVDIVQDASRRRYGRTDARSSGSRRVRSRPRAGADVES